MKNVDITDFSCGSSKAGKRYEGKCLYAHTSGTDKMGKFTMDGGTIKNI
jgi:hypothetical protein